MDFMILKRLRAGYEDLIKKYGKNIVPHIGIVDVFSWRGSYDEVAFTLGTDVSLEDSYELVKKAYTSTFEGYKGGSYKYNNTTPIHFEESHSSCGDDEDSHLEDMVRAYIHSSHYPEGIFKYTFFDILDSAIKEVNASKESSKEEATPSEPSVVYAVSIDYGREGQSVKAIFSTEELAQKYIDKVGDKDLEIEEYDFNPSPDDVIKERALAKLLKANLTAEERKALGLS